TVDYDHVVFVCDLNKIEYKDTLTTDGRRIKENAEFNERARKINDRKGLVQNYGYYNLTSMDLSLNEVAPIEVSPSQKTIIFPGKGELLVKEDLDFVFTGAVLSGKFEVYVNE